LSDLRSRGGYGFPGFKATRFASRIATICLACERVTSRPAADTAVGGQSSAGTHVIAFQFQR